MKEGKTTLAEIKRRYPFENTVLADIAEVNPIVIHRMLTGQPVERFQADGYNVGVNCGEAAGQTIRHLHVHLIPRYTGDVPNPRGGIRKFLANPLSEYPPS